MHVTGLELAELASAWEATDPDVAAARAEREAALPRRGAQAGLGLRLQGVAKSYGARAVLRDIALDIEPGSFVALVGRSGCGKSTLLRLLAGLERADAGAITLPQGQPLAAHRDDIRIMFQDARLLPWKRVIDNVALGLAGPDARDRAHEALAQVGLADRAGDWPAVLSGGMRRACCCWTSRWARWTR
jgi:sulfonate transport system ATP-binding protein